MSRKGIGTYIRKADKQFILSIGYCVYCGCTDTELHIDHIHPLNKGGNSERSNLTSACKRCNSLKWDYDLYAFYLRLNDKRDKCREVFNKYASRYERYKKRNIYGTRDKDIDYCTQKILSARKEHNYYTKIIYSLLNKNYCLWDD